MVPKVVVQACLLDVEEAAPSEEFAGAAPSAAVDPSLEEHRVCHS